MTKDRAAENKEKKRECNKKWRAANPDYDRKWHATNLERVRATARKWRVANLDYYRKWYAANLEKVKATKKKWYAANSEKIKDGRRKWRAANPERVKASRRKYYVANLEKIKAYKKNYRATNPERVKITNKKYHVANLERVKATTKKYYQLNKAKIKEGVKKYRKDRCLSDECFTIMLRLRRSLRFAFKQYSETGKLLKANEYGIDYKAIIEHLGPCPGNRKDYHIDHIKPLSSFDFNNPKQVRLAFAPENHQWLTTKENMRKGNSIECSVDKKKAWLKA